MNQKEDSAWVFDSLIGFLQGPIWSAPLMTFIEEKSLIFEADTEDSSEYHKLYQEYKNLVDLLLGSFMEDMEITPEQFEHACTINKNIKMPIKLQQSLFEQIWAANEYEIFKRMMIQKNLELQLQALNMIEQKYGLTPASLIYDTTEIRDNELIMEELIHERVPEYPAEKELIVSSQSSLLDEHRRLASEYEIEKALLQNALETSTEVSAESTAVTNFVRPVNNSSPVNPGFSKRPEALKKLTPLTPIPLTKKEEEKEEEEEEEEAEGGENVNKQKESTTEEDMKKRREYLKARRDELVALKKEARSQRLERDTTMRPGSAKVVAETTLKGKQELETGQSVDPSILHVRKALAARLKAEVVHK